jgi:ABC-type transport system involved in multi-copper enzyme maturation permease subunit
MVANTELERVGMSGWRTGLANLLRKENRAWWASRRWLVQSLVWTVVVNGLVAAVVFILAPMVDGDPVGIGLEMLFKFGGMALAIGVIVLVQDAIIGERKAGVTEWLLSKPMSRPAYVLSKLLAHGLAVLVILVGLQGAIAYGLLWLAVGEPLPLPPYLVGMAGLAVNALFYLALALMMGVLTANRAVLLGASLGLVLIGFFAVPLGATVSTLVMLTPCALVHVLPAAVQGTPLPLPIWLPIGITAILSAIFVAVGIVRFQRLEF